MKYYIIAGEASGDLHGSMLMRALIERDPAAHFRFWGGEKMAAVSGDMVRDYRDTAVMGIVEVLSKAGRLRRNLAFCKEDILAYAPDVVILIDYPGFNLKIARFAHEHGLRVYYYIAPKVWASRESRVEQLKQYVDKLFVIFPFEVEWFRSRGIEPVYEGNPLVEHIDTALAAAPSREEFLKKYGLDSGPLIALLPGSRMQEIKYLEPRFMKVVEDGWYQYAIAAAPGIAPEVYDMYFPGVPVVEGDTYALLKYASAAAVASGTASLEAAIIGTPQVVCYGMNPITWRIAISILKVKYISLANLILDKPIFKELLQEKCTPEAISAELQCLAGDTDCRAAIAADYATLRTRLGESGAAKRIADVLYRSIAD
ncbi:MAG: lipid-A-disaccharide synthase [Bacteroidales bacterium]|nr:lipid-A-disaccharide synthase [Bacteroidales bacterium]